MRRLSSTFISLLIGALLGPGILSVHAVEFSSQELGLIESHGPWPPDPPPDPGNRSADDPLAIRLGATLFSSPGLSRSGDMSCRTCHQPQRSFADGQALGEGRSTLDRNTPGLLNLAYSRWFGWDGAADSLWAQSIRPILAKEEMNADAEVVRAHLNADQRLREDFTRVFGAAPDDFGDEALLSRIGKLLSAYQRTLITPRTQFDDFRDALLAGNADSVNYPEAAQRGLKLFVGRGRCSLCHFGPTFTNGEFATVGVPHLKHDGDVDRGRLTGIRTVRRSVYNLAGPHNDEPASRDSALVNRIRYRHDSFGEFKVPGLRGVAGTAPYMHNGSLVDLEAVVRHYSEPDMSRFHHQDEGLIRPLGLSEREVADLVAFLESLGNYSTQR